MRISACSFVFRKEVPKQDDDGEGLYKFSEVIVGPVPGYPEWVNIKYDNDDDLYVEKLEGKIKKGSLVFCDEVK